MPIYMTVEYMVQKLGVRFPGDERGATSIEYGFIALGIALAIAGAAVLLGGSLSGTYREIAGSI